MPRELAQAVKEYMIENSEKYHTAARQTGIFNNSAIYYQANQVRSKSGEKPVFFNVDDPYWQDFAQKNYRREDNWRVPSVLAWDHKPRGLLGEIIDIEKLEKAYDEYYKEEQGSA